MSGAPADGLPTSGLPGGTFPGRAGPGDAARRDAAPDGPLRHGAAPGGGAPPGSALTHFDAAGRAVMVDVGAKDVTERCAVAGCRVTMLPETLALIRDGRAAKGDVLGVARLAGIMAAKRTADLIPLCHPLPLSAVSLDLEPDGADGVAITATVKTTGRTGVEMEALTAASVAALTVYDMCKAVDRGMRIDGLRLLHKSGGKSGDYEAR